VLADISKVDPDRHRRIETQLSQVATIGSHDSFESIDSESETSKSGVSYYVNYNVIFNLQFRLFRRQNRLMIKSFIRQIVVENVRIPIRAIDLIWKNNR
jgi:hypothetical protein